MESKRKQYKLPSNTIDKIEKLKAAKERENLDFKIYEKDIIVESIDYAYSAKFGKDVFDQTMTKLETVLGNTITNVLNEYAIRFVHTLENIYILDEQIKEMQLLILKANEILPESQNELNALIMMNDKLDHKIKEAVLLKKEMNNK